MKYQGGKQRISSVIADKINSLIWRNQPTSYIEPFLGMGSVFVKVNSSTLGTKWGCDFNPDIISYWQKLQRGWLPPSKLSKEQYDYFKGNPHVLDNSPHYRAWVSIGCSYGGKVWGGYAQDGEGKRNYAREAKDATYRLYEQLSPTSNISYFNAGSYDKWLIPSNSLTYCDPPYLGTTGYKGTPNFNHYEFWNWAIELANSYPFNRTVLVSEYSIPDEFEKYVDVIWHKETKTSLSKNNYGNRVEKLYKIKG